jgi:hypothetical protein
MFFFICNEIIVKIGPRCRYSIDINRESMCVGCGDVSA